MCLKLISVYHICGQLVRYNSFHINETSCLVFYTRTEHYNNLLIQRYISYVFLLFLYTVSKSNFKNERSTNICLPVVSYFILGRMTVGYYYEEIKLSSFIHNRPPKWLLYAFYTSICLGLRGSYFILLNSVFPIRERLWYSGSWAAFRLWKCSSARRKEHLWKERNKIHWNESLTHYALSQFLTSHYSSNNDYAQCGDFANIVRFYSKRY